MKRLVITDYQAPDKYDVNKLLAELEATAGKAAAAGGAEPPAEIAVEAATEIAAVTAPAVRPRTALKRLWRY